MTPRTTNTTRNKRLTTIGVTELPESSVLEIRGLAWGMSSFSSVAGVVFEVGCCLLLVDVVIEWLCVILATFIVTRSVVGDVVIIDLVDFSVFIVASLEVAFAVVVVVDFAFAFVFVSNFEL